MAIERSERVGLAVFLREVFRRPFMIVLSLFLVAREFFFQAWLSIILVLGFVSIGRGVFAVMVGLGVFAIVALVIFLCQLGVACFRFGRTMEEFDRFRQLSMFEMAREIAFARLGGK